MPQDSDRRGEPPEPPCAEAPPQPNAASSADSAEIVCLATFARNNPDHVVQMIHKHACLVCGGSNFHFTREVEAIALHKALSATRHDLLLRNLEAYLRSIVERTSIDLARQDKRRRHREATDGLELATTRAAHDADRVPDARTALIIAAMRERMGDLALLFDLRMRGLNWNEIAMHLEPAPTKSEAAVRRKAKALAKRYQRKFQIASAEVAAMLARYDA
jgi:hypothetical protein